MRSTLTLASMQPDEVVIGRSGVRSCGRRNHHGRLMRMLLTLPIWLYELSVDKYSAFNSARSLTARVATEWGGLVCASRLRVMSL